MNIAKFSHFVPLIIIFGTSLLCYSILKILLMLVVSSRLWLIILWTTSRLWLIVWWIMLSMGWQLWSIFISLKWWVFRIYIFLPIDKKNLLISALVPIIPITSYSTGDFLPWSLIFLEKYDSLLNEMFLSLL